jgi:O-antigen/teichoic acid export membrane protein
MSISEPAAKAPNYYKSSFIFLVLSLINAGLNYAYYPVIARFLSTSEFGAVQALIAILLQIGAIFAGLNLVTIYLVNKLDFEQSKKAIEILQKITTSIFLLATLAVIAFQSAVMSFLHIDKRLLIFIVCLDLITTIPFIISFGYLQAKRRFVAAGVLQFSIVLTKLLAGAVLAKKFGISGALAGIAAGQVLGMFIFWLAGKTAGRKLWDHRALGSLSLPSLADLAFIRPLAKTIVSIFIVNVMLAIFISFDIIAARHYFAPSLSGLYAAASTISNAIVFVCLPLISVLLPHLDIAGLAKNRTVLLKTSVMVFLVGALSITVLATAPRQLLGIFGGSYQQMSYLLWRLGILMSLVAAISLVMQVGAFYAPARTAVITIAGFLALLVGIVHSHGTPAAFVSTIMAVFATIALVGILQIIWTYNHGSR